MSRTADLVAAIAPLDPHAASEARARQDMLTKPRGALGVLEDVSVQLAGITGICPPPVPTQVGIAVFAGDHGVHAQGVSPWPQEVTGQMVANIASGGAVISVLARALDARLVVVDVGVASDLEGLLPEDASDVLLCRVRPGTADMTLEPAMSRGEAEHAMAIGADVAGSLIDDGAQILAIGDMGIANTTPSAALVAVFTGQSPAAVTGRGTGIDDAMLSHKIEVIDRALALHRPDPVDPTAVVAAVGGLEHAAIAGFILAAAGRRVPVVLDGVIAAAGALVAAGLAPLAVDVMLAGHRSVEPGASVALAHLGLRPLVDLDLRLGEGSGAALAIPLVQAAARVLAEVATFDSAGVTDKEAPV